MFTSVKAEQACDQIVQQIEQIVLSGQLNLGERLPSERALAKRFGVSRMTLHRAMQQLERMGLVEARGGRGTFISLFARAEISGTNTSNTPLMRNGR